MLLAIVHPLISDLDNILRLVINIPVFLKPDRNGCRNALIAVLYLINILYHRQEEIKRKFIILDLKKYLIPKVMTSAANPAHIPASDFPDMPPFAVPAHS